MAEEVMKNECKVDMNEAIYAAAQPSQTSSNLHKNGGGGGGVYITWEDLWVTVANNNNINGGGSGGGGGGNNRKAILEGVGGYARPGEVLAIMGPSGCGKSTLLDALAGNLFNSMSAFNNGRLDSRTNQSGDILINGRKQQLAYGTSAYVTQEDILPWTLTVKEAINYSAQLQLPITMSTNEKKQRAENTIREMGLQESMNTRIGGCGNKGLSNGQKRRVSICIEILTRPKLLFLDEPTSGLDSAASYHVMRRIVELSEQYGMTICASIHQPVSEVFHLLHNLCLLSLGRMVYFGPSRAANRFFEVNGFACPALQNPSDYYLRVINTDFNEDIDHGSKGKMITTDEVTGLLIKSYRISDACKEMLSHIAEIHRQKEQIIEKGSDTCFFKQCLILTKRSYLNMYRDLGYYWVRLIVYVALGLGLGSVFYNVGNTYSSIQARGSMLMFVASLLTIMAIGGFPSLVEDMKVFRRERLNGHYGAAAFVVSNTLSSIPFLLLISMIPGAITYYLVGLQRGSDKFPYFILILLACMMLVESLMMIVAAVVPNFLVGLITGAGIQGLMMLSGGFFRLPNDLPKLFWKYPLYYIAFHKYAYQGLYKNEFEGLRFYMDDDESSVSARIDGESILKNVWQVEMGYSKWIDLAILFGMVILYKFVFLGVARLVKR